MNPGEVIGELAAGRATLRIVESRGRGRALAEVTLRGGATVQLRLTLRALPGAEVASMALYRSQDAWTTEELTARGLPLYWSKDWLNEHLLAYRNLREIEAKTGYSPKLLAAWKRRHKITNNPREDAIREDWANTRFPTKHELASAYGISVPTLTRILNRE